MFIAVRVMNCDEDIVLPMMKNDCMRTWESKEEAVAELQNFHGVYLILDLESADVT